MPRLRLGAHVRALRVQKARELGLISVCRDVNRLPALIGAAAELGAMLEEPRRHTVVSVRARIVQPLPPVLVGVAHAHAGLHEQ